MTEKQIKNILKSLEYELLDYKTTHDFNLPEKIFVNCPMLSCLQYYSYDFYDNMFNYKDKDIVGTFHGIPVQEYYNHSNNPEYYLAVSKGRFWQFNEEGK